MKRFSVFLLTTVLSINCTACSTVQNLSVENSQEESADNAESILGSVEFEEINEFEIAQQAYDLIEGAESVCKSGMGIISAVWHFGIWEAPECEIDVVMERLSAQIGYDVSFIKENGGYTVNELIHGDDNFGGWEFCLMATENCLSAAGAYTSVNEALDIARDLIRKIPDEYANYQNLKDYNTKVAAYATYFENVSGSYNGLKEAITDYESNIQAAKEPLLLILDNAI